MSNQPRLRAAILVVSDTAFVDPGSDRAGETLSTVLRAGSWDISQLEIVPDHLGKIRNAIEWWCDEVSEDERPNLIITTGGTGFAVKDVTPETVEALLDRRAPGLVHAMLAKSLEITPFAMMSRPVAGVRNKTVIVTLPGSPKGAKENLESILKLLPHACIQAAGGNSRSLHAGGLEKLEKEAGIDTKVSKGPKVANGGHSHDQATYHDNPPHHHHTGHSHSHGHGHTIPKPHTRPEDRPQSNDPFAGPTHRHRSSPYPMLSVEEALSLILNESPLSKPESVPVDTALVGRILAENVTADEGVPAFRASIVDGYAVVVAKGLPSPKGIFSVASVSHAAPGKIAPLATGQIARITTGAPLPPNANAVVMVEDTLMKSMTDDSTEEKEVEILTDQLKPGENVREIGSDIEQGVTILKKGDKISVGELGLLASVGRAKVLAYRKPVVGVLSTGDEIVRHDRPGELKYGEVRDCNRPTIMATVRSWGFHVIDLGIASDTSGSLEESLRSAFREVDTIVTTGGVSMGELDLLKPTLERSLGGTIHFGRVSMKPGKPTTFATVPFKNAEGDPETRLVFSLPGNPASAIVTSHLFVLPSLARVSGEKLEVPASEVKAFGLPRATVVLDEEVTCDKVREEYQRARVDFTLEGYLKAVLTGGQRSSRVGSFQQANALLILPAGGGELAKGQKVEAMLM